MGSSARAVTSRALKIPLSELRLANDPTKLLEERLGATLLRWFVVGVDGDQARIEATTVEGVEEQAAAERGAFVPGRAVVVHIVPTGIACELGGYAGDASCANHLLSACSDYVVTNPNTLNASDFVGNLEKVLYVEGYCLDLFAKGIADLWLPTANKVGLVVERADNWKLDVVYNVANAVRAIHGVDVVDIAVTDEALGTRSSQNPSGAYAGTIDNVDTLFRACQRVIDAGATAIAVTSAIEGLEEQQYAEHFEGRHPNPMGGVEAVVSHLIVRRFGLPAAHAPMINLKGGARSNERRAREPRKIALHSGIVDPRGAGELVSASGLACVLMGLRRAPQTRQHPKTRFVDRVSIDNAIAVIAPASALGGIPVLHGRKQGIPLIAVRDNKTILDAGKKVLGLDEVIEVQSYAEAAGVVLALRHGISLDSIRRPLLKISPISAEEDVQEQDLVAVAE